MNDVPNPLRSIASNVQKKLLADLGEASAIKHSTTKGDNAESVWIELLRKYLPVRFRVDSAIIIDSTGETSEQIDCVIYDAHFTPRIIPTEVSLFIPAEAVHAVFEVKQKIIPAHLHYAANKVQSVRKLHRTSADYTGDGRTRGAKPKFDILGGLLARSITWKDGFASKHFDSALYAAQQIEHLDFIFAADSGYADMVKTQERSKNRDTNQEGVPMPIKGPTGISYGLLRLLEELTRQGTVPAVDWSEYYKNLV